MIINNLSYAQSWVRGRARLGLFRTGGSDARRIEARRIEARGPGGHLLLAILMAASPGANPCAAA